MLISGSLSGKTNSIRKTVLCYYYSSLDSHNNSRDLLLSWKMSWCSCLIIAYSTPPSFTAHFYIEFSEELRIRTQPSFWYFALASYHKRQADFFGKLCYSYLEKVQLFHKLNIDTTSTSWSQHFFFFCMGTNCFWSI